MRRKHKTVLRTLLFMAMAVSLLGGAATAQTKKPNILVIWGDDVGQFNVSAYNMGMMGYKTPNIRSHRAEGALFTDWYGQQSCTAGRAASSPDSRPSARASRKWASPARPRA